MTNGRKTTPPAVTDPESILKDFDRNETAYRHFGECLQRLLPQLIHEAGVKLQSIECRPKSRESLQAKLARPGKSYGTLTDVTDLSGIRIITYFAVEVDQVAEILNKEFDIDFDHSVDKRVFDDADRFGYKSLHYVVSLLPSRAELPEYRPFRDLKAEIQVRTVIQHAWAEIEHDLGYKSEAAVPREIKRRLFRLAALLEMADEEFAAVNANLTRYGTEVRLELAKGEDAEIEIDSTSIAEFVATDLVVRNIDQAIVECAG